MIALIATDQLGETSSGPSLLSEWICQGRLGGLNVRPSHGLLTNTDTDARQFPVVPVIPSTLRPEGGYVFAQIERCLVNFCTRADSTHITIGRKSFS